MKTHPRSQTVAFAALACGIAATLLAWYLVGREAEREARAGFAGPRPDYWVIEYLEPTAGNEPAFGLDILTRAVTDAARRSRGR